MNAPAWKKELYTLEFCLWLQRYFDFLVVEARQ